MHLKVDFCMCFSVKIYNNISRIYGFRFFNYFLSVGVKLMRKPKQIPTKTVLSLSEEARAFASGCKGVTCEVAFAPCEQNPTYGVLVNKPGDSLPKLVSIPPDHMAPYLKG